MNIVMNRLKTTFRLACLALVAGLLGTPLAAQDAGSIDEWIAQLRSGTLAQKVDAAGKLAQENPSTLPVAAQVAIVQELERINQALLGSSAIPGVDELGGEIFAEYYLDLVIPTAHFSSPEAKRALVRSVGVGGGIQRRVARQGDPAIPGLVEMIRAGYQAGDALETLGLAWFWADSTGAVLSDRSRGQIVQAMIGAMESDDYSQRRHAVVALGDMNDPAFLALARSFLADAQGRNQGLIVRALRQEAIPALAAAESKLSTTQLAERSLRSITAVCDGAAPAPKLGACTSLENQLTTALSHLGAGQLRPAHNVLSAALQRAEQARASGAFSALEHTVIAGSIQNVLARLGPP